MTRTYISFSIDCDIKVTLMVRDLVSRDARKKPLDCVVFATVPGKSLQKQGVTRCLTRCRGVARLGPSKPALSPRYIIILYLIKQGLE